MPVTRRNFLKGALALAGSGMGGALSVPALMTLLPPPVVRCNSDEAYDTLLFKEREPGKWYEPLAGKVARKEDFALNQAAMVTWAPYIRASWSAGVTTRESWGPGRARTRISSSSG